jgi:hypothetical protein
MSNNNLGVRTASETLRTESAAVITAGAAGYIKLGTAILNPSRAILFQNFTDVTLAFSDDGTNDKFELPSNGFLLFDEMANRSNASGSYGYALGTQFWVRYLGAANPTVGSANLSTWYAQNL